MYEQNYFISGTYGVGKSIKKMFQEKNSAIIDISNLIPEEVADKLAD
ncbi:MAG: hypothetical protein WAV31_02280 [Candidatus Moraniibacteriota bacterium]